jgi:hypothetical protein
MALNSTDEGQSVCDDMTGECCCPYRLLFGVASVVVAAKVATVLGHEMLVVVVEVRGGLGVLPDGRAYR